MAIAYILSASYNGDDGADDNDGDDADGDDESLMVVTENRSSLIEALKRLGRDQEAAAVKEGSELVEEAAAEGGEVVRL
jgi:hypothetical protein